MVERPQGGFQRLDDESGTDYLGRRAALERSTGNFIDQWRQRVFVPVTGRRTVVVGEQLGFVHAMKCATNSPPKYLAASTAAGAPWVVRELSDDRSIACSALAEKNIGPRGQPHDRAVVPALHSLVELLYGSWVRPNRYNASLTVPPMSKH